MTTTMPDTQNLEDLAHQFLKLQLAADEALAALKAEETRLKPWRENATRARREFDNAKAELFNLVGDPGTKIDYLDTVTITKSNPKPVEESYIDTDALIAWVQETDPAIIAEFTKTRVKTRKPSLLVKEI